MGDEKGGCFLLNPIPSVLYLFMVLLVIVSIARLCSNSAHPNTSVSPSTHAKMKEPSALYPEPCPQYSYHIYITISYFPISGLFQHGTVHLGQKTGEARPSIAEKEFPLDLVWCSCPNIPGKILAFLFHEPTS